MEYTKNISKLLLIVLFISSPVFSKRVEIRNGSFYVDQEKFFVKGIGYECGARPGRAPWTRKYEPDLRRYDIRLIKSAGFNTVRSWAPYMESEMEMFEGSDLRVI